MVKEMLDKNKIILEKTKLFESQNYDQYIPCLLSHYVELITALQGDDIEGIIKVFKECKIPRKHWYAAIYLLKKLYDSNFQSWELGP